MCMTYTKPIVERTQVIGQMAITMSQCDALGGKWDGGVCYKPAQPAP